MAPMTPAEGMVELERRLRLVAKIPGMVISQAHLQLIGKVPVYTGTYQRAIVFAVSPDKRVAQVYVDLESLQAAAAGGQDVLFGQDPAKALDYIYKNVHGQAPEGPYVVRIEEHGRPTDKTPSGQDLWVDAFMSVLSEIHELLGLAARGELHG